MTSSFYNTSRPYLALRFADARVDGIIQNTPPFTAGTLALGFPKRGVVQLSPFVKGAGFIPAREVKSISCG